MSTEVTSKAYCALRHRPKATDECLLGNAPWATTRADSNTHTYMDIHASVSDCKAYPFIRDFIPMPKRQQLLFHATSLQVS